MTSKGERSGRRLVVHRRRSPEKEHAEPPSMKLHLPKFQIAQKLPLALIGSALVVGLGIGAAAYNIGLQTVEQQRQERMDASIQSGLDQVQSYFDNVSVDLKLFAARADTVTQIENMTRAYTALNIQGHGAEMLQMSFITNDPHPPGQKILSDSAGQTAGDYDGQHRRFHPGWRTVLQERGYDDIMLFNPAGVLIYTAEKNKDFIADFSKGSGNPLSEGDLGNLFRRVSAIRGLGQTGEAIIVGPDGLMRTQSHFSTDPNVLVTPVRSDIVTAAIGGQRASGVLNYRGEEMVGLA